eukprot:138460-Chlamydomonas_euryale.AAC.1
MRHTACMHRPHGPAGHASASHACMYRACSLPMLPWLHVPSAWPDGCAYACRACTCLMAAHTPATRACA